MSDTPQPPPAKPKPGSLRDRIAAFEKPAPSSVSKPPPPVRPKPGNIAWKPTPSSPPSNTTETPENDDKKPGGMSASDAKESIGRGVSLKERMAALQGKGAFGGGMSPSPPPPGPKPAKRPPLVVSSPPVEEPEEQAKELGEEKLTEEQGKGHVEAVGRGTFDPLHPEDTENTRNKDGGFAGGEEAVEEEQDEEAKERERRAAIAARMARLGGARVGMAPPVFGKKPEVKTKLNVASPTDVQPTETNVSVAREKGMEVIEVQTPEPHASPETSALHPTVPTLPEDQETASDTPRIVTDDNTSKDTRPAPLPQPSVHSPTSDSDASPIFVGQPTLEAGTRPTPNTEWQNLTSDASSSRTSLASSRSPPPSMPIPAVPRRTGPPRSKSSRNMKAEAKRQDQVISEVPAVAPQAQEEIAGASIVMATTQQELPTSARQGQEPATEQDPLEPSVASLEQGVNASEDSDDNLATSQPVQNANEGEVAQGVSEVLRDVTPEQPHETIIVEPAVSQTDDIHTPEPEVEAHTPTAEESTPNHLESIVTPHELEEPLIIEPRVSALPELEISVTGEPSMEDNAHLHVHDMKDLTPAAYSSDSPLPVEASTPPHAAAESETITKTALEEQVEPKPPQVVAAMEAQDEVEDEEFARKKRIAERMAKMGGRNPFAAGPLFGAAGLARKTSGDETHEGISVLSHTNSSAVEQGREDADSERETLAEAVVETDSHEANDQEPRFSGVAEGQDSDVFTVEDSFEEHTAIDPEYTSTPHLTHPGPEDSEEIVETAPPEQEGLQASEEFDEMAPPRITRPVPLTPPLPQAHNDDAITPAVEMPPEPISQRRPILPAHVVSVLRDAPEAEEEEEGSSVRSASPDQGRGSPLVSIPSSILPVGTVWQAESEKDSPLPSSISRRSMPSPPRAVPIAPTTSSTEIRSPIRSPISPSSRRSIPPPPRSVPVLPNEEKNTGKDFSPPASPQRTVSPPARPPPVPQMARSISPETVFAADAQADTRGSIEEQEVLAESEPDPIDPAFYSPPRSPIIPHDFQPSFGAGSQDAYGVNAEEDTDQTRRKTIAERMAKLGGIRFGAPPPVPRKPNAPMPEVPSADEAGKDDGEEDPDTVEDMKQTSEVESDEADSEEAERARRQAIAARLAGMGGMRFGMMPQVSAPTHPRGASDDSARTTGRVSPPPRQPAHAPPRPLPAQPAAIEVDSESISDEGVKVEAGSEMSMEEVNPEDAEEDAEEIPPPVPSRPSRQPHLPPVGRPPVPTSAFSGRPPVPKTEPKRSSISSSIRRASGSSGPHVPPSGDFVMVDEEEAPPPPPPPRSRPPRPVPPPASSSKDSGSPWELPEIPRGSLDVNVVTGFGVGDASVSLEDSTTYPSPSTAPVSASMESALPSVPAPAVRADVQLSPDELMQLWGTIGTAVHAAASALFDKSKKSVVGDGTSQGFVNAVLAEVPHASKASYGHLFYSQNGSSILRRSSNIMPGDIVQLMDAKLKGHKGLQSYHQTVGTGHEPLVCVVSDFDTKKSKVKVFQANQHVGSQTVETASYRLDDLKSGNVKVFRVASA